MITEEELRKWFNPVNLTPDQTDRLKKLNDAALGFALEILANTKPGEDQKASFQYLRRCVKTMTQAIFFEEDIK